MTSFRTGFALLFSFAPLFGALLAERAIAQQTTPGSEDNPIVVCYTPGSHAINGGNGQDLDNKLENAANFGPDGVVDATLRVQLIESPITEEKLVDEACDIFHLGMSNADSRNTAFNDFSVEEIDALYAWSTLDQTNVAMVSQAYVTRWGDYGVQQGAQNPMISTELGERVAFDGPFGAVLTNFNQGGSWRGILTPGPQADACVLVTDSSGQRFPVITVDRPSGDIVYSDNGILLHLGGVTRGDAITSNNDIIFGNLFALAIRTVRNAPSDVCAVIEEAPVPDFSVSALSIDEGQCPASVGLSARIGNIGGGIAPAGTAVDLVLETTGRRLGRVELPRSLAPGEFEDLDYSWDDPIAGPAEISLTVDPDDAVEELSQANNQTTQSTFLCRTDCAASLSVRPKRDKIQLTWSHVEAAGYEILRSTSPDSGFAVIATTTSDYSTYLDQDVVQGETYYYRVRRTPGGDGNESCTSQTAAAFLPRGRIRSAQAPNLVGEAAADAGAILAGVNLTEGAATFAPSETVLRDIILSQTPSAGSSLAQGASVDYVISSGSSIVNTPPVISAAAPTAPTEGGFLLIAGTVADPDNQTLSGVASFSDGVSRPFFIGADGAFVVSRIFEDDATFAVDIVIDDGAGGQDIETISGVIANVAPALNLPSAALAAMGEAYTLARQFTDPGADEWTGSVDYGDGGGAEPLILDGRSFMLSHVYETVGDYTITVTIRDDDGGVGAASVPIRVAPATVAVPDVTGETLAAAQAALEAALLTAGDIDEAETRDVAAGLIASQSPMAGASVVEGAGVALTVSSGFVNDPPVIGGGAPPAAVAREGELYTYAVPVNDPDPDERLTFSLNVFPPGMTIDPVSGLISWTPPQGAAGETTVSVTVTDRDGAGDTLNYVVTVFDDTPTTAPNIVGLTSEAARAAIASASLDVGAVTTLPSEDVAVGVVLSQSPAPGTTVPAGSPVAFAVSGGPASDRVSCEIISPAQGVDVEKQTPVIADLIGASIGPNASEPLTWQARVRRPDADEASVIASGTGPLSEDQAALFDPSLIANDAYRIELGFAQGGLSGFCATEVNVVGNRKLGNFRLDFVDLNVPLSGAPITITRRYDTLDLSEGDFGHGWRLGYQGEVRDGAAEGEPFTVGARVTVTLPGGERRSFRFDPVAPSFLFPWVLTPGFTPEAGNYATLEAIDVPSLINSNGFFYRDFGNNPYNPSLYRLTLKDGTAYVIDEFDGIQSITDTNGNALTFAADGVTHSNGARIAFSRDGAGRIETITDLDGNVIRYAYSPQGDLLSVTDQAGLTTQFTYYDDPAHFLNEVIDPLGRMAQRTEYDEDGRVAAVIDALGNRTEQSFNLAASTSSIIDARGNRTTIFFDDRGNVLREIDPLGGVTRYEYGDPANPDLETAITDRNGNTTRYAYDAQGNVTQITDALGGVTRFQFNELSSPTRVEDARGAVTTLTYDASNNPTRIINGLGHEASMTYAPNGDVASVTDFEGNTTTLEYDGDCDCGLPSRIVNPDGTERRFTYNAFGALISEIDETGAVRRTEYDASGRTLREIDPAGAVTSYFYEGQNLARITDPLGHETRYEYNDRDEEIRVIDARSGVTARAYDKAGNLITVTDPVGNITRFVYDANNRRTRMTDPLGNEETYAYDAAGNRTRITDRNGRDRTFVYDGLNRLTEERWDDGTVFEYAYDAAGNRLSAAGPDNRQTAVFDLIGQVMQLRFTNTPNAPDLTLTYAYDANGLETAVTDDSGVRVATEYDSLSRVAARVWSGGAVAPARVEFERDERGFLSGVQRFADAGGMSLGGRTEIFRDPRGLVEQMVHRRADGGIVNGADYRHTYDLAGRLTEASHHGNLAAFDYDAANQLTGVTNTLFPAESFQYDLNGNRTNSSDHGAAYVTGPGNQLLEDSKNRYAYDANGNLTTVTEISTSALTRYVWDHRNRLTRTDLPGGDVVEFVYDADDRMIGRTENGVPRATLYDGANAWADYEGGVLARRYLFDIGIDSNLASQAPGEGIAWYLADRLGSVHDIVDTGGTLLEQRDYRAFGALRDPADLTDRYAFTGREYDAALGDYFYRARRYAPVVGRFTGLDPLSFAAGDANLYRYVGNAPTNATDPTGTTAIGRVALRQITAGITAGALLGARNLATRTATSRALQQQGVAAISRISRQIACTFFTNAAALEVGGGIVIAQACNVDARDKSEQEEKDKITLDLSPPGNCDPDQHRRLQDSVKSNCNRIPRCEPGDPSSQVSDAISRLSRCIDARRRINRVCFNGGDVGHRQQVNQLLNQLRRCKNSFR